ncbi:MAG: hypothetical protein U9R05_10760 [Chloroflexota bacterium]|nr:hypothetical protein [Chloroflexota bacterium]
MQSKDGKSTPKIAQGILAIVLWAGTAVGGFLLIPTILDLVIRIYVRFWGSTNLYGPAYWGAVVLRNLLILPLAGLCLVMVIGGAEYHSRHFNETSLWRLFTRTIAVEVSLFILAFML